MRAALILTAFLLSTTPANSEELHWFKGNTHAHTINSDGDSTPDEVVRWYREHGYHFLVLTDHNYLTPVDGLNAVHAAPGKFLVIPGEEVSDLFEKRPIHVNGLDVESLVEPQGGKSVAETIQRNVDAIRGVGGIPHINHPNFGWAISAEDLARVSRTKLFEIFNGHPLVNNHGGGGRPGLEEVWDTLLSSGMLIYGIATDDAHHFKRPGDSNASLPGRGWVVVRASSLQKDQILAAMERGDFYASTGVDIDEIADVGEEVSVRIRPRGDTSYTTWFIGRGGKVLFETGENPAVYRPSGNEGYVRARIRDSNGRMAWTQPRLVGEK